MSYPDELQYFLSRLQNVSTNTFKLEPQGSNSASANKIIRISLPSNALLSTRSFKLHFSASVDGAGAGGRLPANIASLVDRVEVACGGVQLSAGCNAVNVLQNAKNTLEGRAVCPVLGHPAIVRQISYVDGATITTTNNEVLSTADGAVQFAIENFEGFLNSCEPRIIDSALVPDMVVSIYLADNSVLSSSAGVGLDGLGAEDITDNGTATATWSMSNIHASIETIGYVDATYDNMIRMAVSSDDGLQVPFKQYISFQDTITNSMRFSCATQSLDKIWVIHREDGFGVQKAPRRVEGYKKYDATNTEGGIAGYDAGGVLDTNKEEYVGTYFNFPKPNLGADTDKYQFSLNGSLVPQFQAGWENMYAISKNAVGHSQKGKGLNTMKKNCSVQAVRLNLPNSSVRQICGLDTRGISLNGYYNMYGVSAPKTCNLYAEMTSTLRIFAGRQLDVIQ